MPEPYLRMVDRRFPRAVVQRAIVRAGLRRCWKHAGPLAEQLAIEPLEAIEVEALPEPDPAPPADDWNDDALLETYEREPAREEPADELDRLASVEIIRAKPAADYSRFIAAMKARPARADTAAVPLEPAQSREECRRCGIPGFKGCAHQAPYAPPADARPQAAARR